MLAEWLQQESIGAGVVRARPGCKDAHDEDQNVTSLGVGFELTTERQTIELRDEDLAHDEVGSERANPVQGILPIRRELDDMAGLGKELSGERANVRVSLDDENGEPVGRQRDTVVDIGVMCNVRIRSLRVEAKERLQWLCTLRVRTTVA